MPEMTQHAEGLANAWNSRDHAAPEHHDLAAEASQHETSHDAMHLNVGRTERLGSVLGGSVLALIGLRRRSNFGAFLMLLGGGLIHRGATGYCRVNEVLGRDTAHGGEAPEPADYFQHGVHVEETVTIHKSPADLYNFWRHFENLPQFMDHLKSVKVTDEKHSHWTTKAPAGFSVEWDAEVINDIPDSLIAWRSKGGADVDNAGSVRFKLAEQGGGTEVRVTLDYLPPAGQVGVWVAKLFGEEPAQQVRDDLAKFKQTMEAAEPVGANGQADGQQ